MIKFLPLLKTELTPCIEVSELENADYKVFFEEFYTDATICHKCEELCVISKARDEFCSKGSFYFDVKTIPTEDFKRHRFLIENFLKVIAAKNNIKGTPQKRDDETFYIGTKNVSGMEYDIFYIRNLTDKDKRFINDKRHKLQELKTGDRRLIIITPDEMMQDKTTEDLLRFCEVIRLDKLLENDFAIDGLTSFAGEDLEHLKNNYDLLIISSKEIYLMKNKISLTPQAFKLLNFFAKNPNIAFDRDNCITQVWGESYAEGDKTLSNNISAIRKCLKNSKYADCIKVENKTIRFEFDSKLIYTK